MIAVLSSWVDNGRVAVERPAQQGCKGYTIIEYGIGLDCRGDTVVLEKRGGLQVLALSSNDFKNSYR